jgi:hypothetical protein
MIIDSIIDIGCGVLFALGAGLLIGSHWTRREWIEACRRGKLDRFGGATGKLLWVCDRAEVP